MKKTILILDDCSMMARFLHRLLSDHYHAAWSTNPLDVIEWFDGGFKPDAVLLDYQMCPMDGLTFLTHLRKRFPDVPVIILSGTKHSAFRIECLEAGADDFMLKPFNPRELEIRLDRLLANPSQKPGRPAAQLAAQAA